MTDQEATAGIEALLPKELRIAQEAIDTDEVREILKTLAKYNLGIYMPHMHKRGEAFSVLPTGMVQVEEGMKVTFATKEQAARPSMVSVAWRWEGGRAESVSDCVGVATIGRCHCRDDD